MSSEWPEFYIDEIKAHETSSIAIGPFGSRMKSDCYVDAGVRVVRGTNLTSGREFSGEFVFVTSEKASELGGANLEPNDLVFPHRGAIGEVGIVPDDGERYVLSSSLMKLKCHREKADPQFIFYFFKSATGRFELLKNSSQVGTPGIGQPLTSLKGIRLKLPPVDEQKRIAAVLGALDDRIALLRETNATLEAIAQALFKSWFVDFDPVHTKARGEKPQGMDDATAALFPASFEESELGMIPKGWRTGELGEMLALRNERTKPSDETKSLPYVPIENIGAKTPFLAEFKSGEDANSSLILFKEGDILFGAMRPYFHKVCIAPFKGVTRTTVFTLSARNPKASAFALLLTYQDSTVDYATQHSEGSTIPYAKWKNSLERMPVLIPPDSVQEGFSEIVKSFIDRANANVQQAQTLTQLRDTLLPKLISGQLQLPEAEALLPEELP